MNKQDLEQGLMACVHCGFCLDACPTYRETGDEADSPRGRIVLMRGVFEGKIPLLPEDATFRGSASYHMDRCLGCRGCETACPSGVPYGNLLEHFRNQQERIVRRTPGDKLLREGLLTLLTDPPKMSLALKAGKLTGGKIPAPIARFVGLPADTSVPLPADLAAASRPVPEFTPAIGEKRGRVALLSGCVMSVLYAPVHHATVRVLAANGIEVVCPTQQGCCGALHGHQGKLDQAAEMAKTLIAQLESGNFDAIILNSAGCGSFLKDYRHLLKNEPGWANRALAFAGKIKDVTEYLTAIGARPMPRTFPYRITYHDACHLAHGQKVVKPPRELLKQIPGVTYVEALDADQCCGSAGIYNYLQPKMARALVKKKVENLLATGADYVATGNPGCLAWIEQGIKAGYAPPGAKIPKIVHPIELLDLAYQ